MNQAILPRAAVLLFAGLLVPTTSATAVFAQKESVKPGINKSYEKPDVEQRAKQFEREDREVVRKRKEIVAACGLKPGVDVADVGAGTGLFTRPFARKVAPGGKVYAVDISKPFVDYIEKTCGEQGIENVVGVLSTPTSTELSPESVDVAFICDTYHHFEYPFKMLASIHRALRGGGWLVIVDYKKEEGVSPEWVFGHVRADKKTVIEEVTGAKFKLIDELDVMEKQYLLRFEKTE